MLFLAVSSAICLTISSLTIGGGVFPNTGSPIRPGGNDGWGTYTPESFPDSISDPASCQMQDESLLCDPNNILNDGNVTVNHQAIAHALERVRAETQCACTADDANLGVCKGEGGFTMSVALVKKITLDSNEDNTIDRMQAASKFANTLRVKQDRSQCEDDILIFLSRDDNVMWTAVGTVAERRLTQEIINEVTINAETYFTKYQYTTGLNYTIDMYKRILNGEQVDLAPPQGWYWPFPLWAVITISVVVGLVLIALIGLAIWGCIRCCCSEKEQYTMGTRM